MTIQMSGAQFQFFSAPVDQWESQKVDLFAKVQSKIIDSEYQWMNKNNFYLSNKKYPYLVYTKKNNLIQFFNNEFKNMRPFNF